MKTIFVNDIPIHFKELNNLKLKKKILILMLMDHQELFQKNYILEFWYLIRQLNNCWFIKKMTKHKFKKYTLLPSL